MNAIKTFFANLKLQHKLMLCFTCLTAMLFLAMGGILHVEYARRCINDEMSKVEQVMQQAADALTRSHSLLVRNTSRLLLEENLFQALSALNSGQNIQYAQNYQQINELLSDYVFQMEMIDSVCLFYNGFSYGSQYGLWENDPYGVMDRFVP